MTRIPPKNIYYMLSYAFHVLRPDDIVFIEGESFENIQNIFSEIIYQGVSSQVKRGLTYEYEEVTDDIKTVRGKIDILQSTPYFMGYSDRLVCFFDEYSSNNLMNQVLKTTIYYLLHSENVDKERIYKLKSIIKYFRNTDLINPYFINWSKINYHRNNATYRMLINICRLILSDMLISEKDGKLKLSKYLNDQQEYTLFQNFIKSYYQQNFPKLKAKSKIIEWNVIDKEGGANNLIPEMQTDITLTCGKRMLIIDTKYYDNSIQKSHHSGNKYISSHLYQIQSYVINAEPEPRGFTSGMLLYAKTDNEDFEEGSFIIRNRNKIYIKELDLSADWNVITSKLNSIANNFINEK